jgi:DinB superfamily
MPGAVRRRPSPGEYYEYYHQYVREVPDGDIVDILRDQMATTSAFLAAIPAERVDYRYASGKWSLKEVVAHVVDMEWVFTARALHFARAVGEPLPGVDENDFVRVGNFGTQPWSALIEQYRSLRGANTLLFDGFDDAAWDRKGIASGRSFTARSIPYIIAGHEHHHLGVIRDRYL